MAERIASRLPESFDLVGWSMGGYIAFELYPLVRERIRKMALLCTSARPESLERLRAREELLRSVEVEGLRAVYTRVIDENLVDPSRVDQGYKDEVIAEIVGLGEHTLRNQIKAMIARKDARVTLKSIQHEVLVIGGSRDTVTPLDCSTEITELLPRASLHIVQGAGHALPWERVAEVNGIIRQFLDN
jgi:pimeloyl-ACP methyl ester carboxylesterase